ncbi:MAG TPA: outer membrane lipoprotein-sorting protein [bacterium]|nr:outer membrane lipoprotein-sorting protein [bacterium]
MKKNVVLVSLICLIFMFGGASSFAEELQVSEIVQKANLASYYSGTDGKATVKMVISDKNGKERTREFSLIRKNIKSGGDQNFLVYFHKPADVRKMTFLVLKHITKDDDRWMYMANLDLVKRIAASDKRTSFVGSDFTYEDVSGRNPNEDNHTLIKTDNDYYELKSVPKKKDSVEFTHYILRINKKTFLPEKAEYYKDDKLYRTVEALKTENIQNFPTVIESKVTNIETGSSTINYFSNIQYNIGLKDDAFSEKSLRRPPMNLFK